MVTTACRAARFRDPDRARVLDWSVVSRVVLAGQSLAVGTESHTAGGLHRRPFQRDPNPAVARSQTRTVELLTPTSRGQMGTVGTGDRYFHLVGWAVEREAKWSSGRRIPEFYTVGQPLAGNVVPRTARPGRDQPLAVWSEGDGQDHAGMRLHCQQFTLEEAAEVMPFEAAQVGPAGPGPVFLE